MLQVAFLQVVARVHAVKCGSVVKHALTTRFKLLAVIYPDDLLSHFAALTYNQFGIDEPCIVVRSLDRVGQLDSLRLTLTHVFNRIDVGMVSDSYLSVELSIRGAK